MWPDADPHLAGCPKQPLMLGLQPFHPVCTAVVSLCAAAACMLVLHILTMAMNSHSSVVLQLQGLHAEPLATCSSFPGTLKADRTCNSPRT